MLRDPIHGFAKLEPDAKTGTGIQHDDRKGHQLSQRVARQDGENEAKIWPVSKRRTTTITTRPNAHTHS